MPDPLSPGYHAVPPGHLAAVVTHLERTHPADDPPPEPPHGLWLDGAAKLSGDDYLALFRLVGRDWLWQSRLALPRSRLEALLESPAHRRFRVMAGNEPAGLLELDFTDPDRPELAFFGLAPGRTGRGAGSWLMNEAVTRAFAGGAAALTVHTCTLDAPQALRFYLRNHFVPVRREVEIYADPRDTGLLDSGAAPYVPRL